MSQQTPTKLRRWLGRRPRTLALATLAFLLGVGLAAVARGAPPGAAPAPTDSPLSGATTAERTPSGTARADIGTVPAGTVPADPGLTRRCLRILKKSLSGRAGVAAARALAELGNPKGRDRLLETVERNPRDVYAYASLVWLGEESYVEQAIAAMRDPETSVPVATLYGAAFVRRPRGEAKKRLRAIWSDASQDPVERLWAAASLVEMGDRAARRYLERMLDDRDPYAATVAAGALFAVGEPKAKKRLTAILKDRRSDFWDQAAISFGEHPDPEAFPLLRRTLRRARQPHDRVWLAWALLRTMGYRHGG